MSAAFTVPLWGTNVNRPSAFTQVKWLAIFLAVFFTVSGFAEFAFLKRQVHQSNLAALS